MRDIDIVQVLETCRAAADAMMAAAALPDTDLTPAERRELAAIGTAVHAILERWQGHESSPALEAAQ